MRTTIDLPEDLHAIAVSIARDNRSTLSETVATLLRRALAPSPPAHVSTSPVTGLRVISLGRTVSSEDVRALDDDQ